MNNLYHIFLEKVFSSISLNTHHTQLNTLKNSVINLSFDSEFLHSNEFYEFERELYSILNFLFKYKNDNYSRTIDLEDIKTASSVLSELTSWLMDIIKHRSFSEMVLFYSSFAFFEIQISELLRFLNISHEDKAWFINEHFDLLKKMNLDISVDEDAPYHENQFLKVFKEGIEESNLEKIYELVLSMERGRGFEFPYITKLVAKSLFELDVNLTFNLINQTDSFIKTLFYCDSISFQSLLIPAIFKNEHNTWLIIEIVRNYASLKDQIDTEQAQLCALLLKKLCHINENIFWQFVKLYNNSANAIIILAETFLLVEDKYLFLYTEIIKIDDYYSEEKAKAYNIFFDILFVNGKKSAAIKFSKIVYSKWLSFLDEFLLQEKYTNQIIHTIYDSIVLRFILKTFSPAELFREFNHYVNNIVDLRLQWHKGFQQYQKIYFIILSRLYLLSHFFKYNNKWYHLRNRINKKIEELLSNERVWLLFHDSVELPEVYKTIKKNLQPIRKRLNKK